MVKKLLFGNFKGGVGKTTNSVMVAYELAKKGYKTLVCDLDPQANATQLLRRTYKLQNNEDLDVEKTMMVALQEENLKQVIVPVVSNLYLIPSHTDFNSYPDFLEMKFMPDQTNYQEKRIAYFGQQLKSFESEFDYIIFDVPPTLAKFTDSAIYASDDIIIVLQTQQRSYDGAEVFFQYLQDFYEKYSNVDFDILGILPVLMKGSSGVDNQIINDAEDAFGKDALFRNIIKHMERLKRYDRKGIAEKGITVNSDYHDVKLHKVYLNLTNEILEKLGNK